MSPEQGSALPEANSFINGMLPINPVKCTTASQAPTHPRYRHAGLQELCSLRNWKSGDGVKGPQITMVRDAADGQGLCRATLLPQKMRTSMFEDRKPLKSQNCC